jgi:hypothetical protein
MHFRRESAEVSERHPMPLEAIVTSSDPPLIGAPRLRIDEVEIAGRRALSNRTE